MKTIFSRRDLKNWVDTATSGWENRLDSDVELITESIHWMDNPGYGQDWEEFLGGINLQELVD